MARRQPKLPPLPESITITMPQETADHLCSVLASRLVSLDRAGRGEEDDEYSRLSALMNELAVKAGILCMEEETT